MLKGKTKSGLEFTLRKFKKSDVSALTNNMNNKKIIEILHDAPFPYKKRMQLSGLIQIYMVAKRNILT